MYVPKGFNHSDLITIIFFLADLSVAFYNIAGHEIEAVCIVSYFVSKTHRHAYKERLSSPKDSWKYRKCRGAKITTYP